MANSEQRDVATGLRMQEEMRLAEQAAFLNSVLESSTEYSIVAKDLAGRILAWNEGARRVYGYESADVVGKSTFLLHDPEDVKAGRAQQCLDEARSTGKWSGALTRVRKNGSKFRASVTITLRRDSAGGPTGFTMISRDLTESERIERELRESQEYNRGLIESNVDALMTTDPLAIVTDVNRQMCEITARSREELIGTPFKEYFTDPLRAEDGIRKVLAQDRVTNYELTLHAKNGKETVVSYNATTFRGADGRLRGVFAAARDITEYKALEEQLIGFTELMHDGLAGPVSPEQHEYLGDVLTSSLHLLQLHPILVIDDDPKALRLAERVLREAGYRAFHSPISQRAGRRR